MKKQKLVLKDYNQKSFTAHCIEKRDPKCPASTLDAEVTYFPETEEDTETYAVKINVIAYKNGEQTENKCVEDEFDTKKQALKWIKQEYKSFQKKI